MFELILLTTIFSKWAESKVNKFFFALHTHHMSADKISRLKCYDGSNTSDPSQMRQIASYYYDYRLEPFLNMICLRGILLKERYREKIEKMRNRLECYNIIL